MKNKNDFINLDFQRKKRRGYPETVLCEFKTNKELIEIFKGFVEQNQNVLATRATKDNYNALKKEFNNISYDERAKIITLIHNKIEKIGEVALCAAGTSDIPVAQEAFLCAEFFGSNVKKYYDIGISGLHRLLSSIDEIKKANVIIAVAGMEGTLPGVIAGLVDIPVIALPTSVGYGASFGGLSALLTMLNSCSEGITVVNIDNGFGAGYSANQINRLIEGKKK